MNLNVEYIWIQFFLCASIIVYAGMRLSYLGDVIAEKLKLGRNWVGVTLLALATSLPEVVTSSSAAKIGAINISIGNILGSNLFNLLIIALIAIISAKSLKRISLSRNHIISGCMGIMLISIAALSLIFYNLTALQSSRLYAHLFIGLDSLVIIIAYSFGMRFLLKREKEFFSPVASPKQKKYKHLSLTKTYLLFIFFTSFIVASGIRMAQLGDIIAQRELHFFSREIIIGQTLVGIILVAIATSLPELVVSLGALRLGAYDMAIGNALGSNMLNILIIPICDLFFTRGPILLFSGSSHIFTALLGIIITAIALLGIFYRLEARVPKKLCLDAWLIIAVYLVGLYLMFKLNLVIR